MADRPRDDGNDGAGGVHRGDAAAVVTTEDSPVLLDLPKLGSGVTGRFLGIEGVSVAAARGSLPGIRVGDGEGAGYVVVRELDGRLVFVPDAGFTGTTTFTCTVESETGMQSAHVSRVRVEPAASAREQITFANGSRQASVIEGTDAAIIGALSISETGGVQLPDIRVYEQAAIAPSERFVVAGGRLQALQPLDRVADGVIHLRIDAYEDAFVFASSSFAIEVVSAALSGATSAAPSAAAPQLSLAFSAPAHMRNAVGDAFVFVSNRDSDLGPFEAETAAGEELQAFDAVGDRGTFDASISDHAAAAPDADVAAAAPVPDGPDSFGI